MSTTAAMSPGGENEAIEEPLATPGASNSCGVLGQIDDERLHLMGLIVRSHRLLTDRLGRELEQDVGIPLVFFDVLINVGAAPDGRVTMSRLSNDIALTTGGVTRLVDRMVEAGLVERQACPNDRRSIHVILTVEGRSVLDRAIAAHIEGIDRHLMAHLSDKDRANLAAALTKILAGS
ncbi:MAG TPA: MarR family transcriptional regulator [Acidimicrobiales bacterium]|jgi:MarR family 2-MHQ and catechol resistance regulon transcriptional repressor|nr:MarR family transcriptional regulator [Acidimicrobiales bacterium]